MAEMLRYNAGKAPLSLIPATFTKAIVDHYAGHGLPIPTRLIWQVGAVLDFGAKKYTAHNWRQGGSWTSCLNSALRHLVKMIEGNQIDDESGLPESGHLGCNLAFLLEFDWRGTGKDDRFILSDLEREAVAFELGDHHPLVKIWSYLLDWQEGGNKFSLELAVVELAAYVENNGTPPTSSAVQPDADQLELLNIDGSVTKVGITPPSGRVQAMDFAYVRFPAEPRKPFFSRIFSGLAA